MAVTSSPKKRTRPDVGGKSPVIALNSVVLPAPLAPISARRSPAATENETSSIARSAPNVRVTPSSTRASPDASGVLADAMAITWALVAAAPDHGQLGTSREPRPALSKSALLMPSRWLTPGTTLTTLL